MFRGEMKTYMLLQRLPSLQRDQSIITYLVITVEPGIPFLFVSSTAGACSGINRKYAPTVLASPFVSCL
jgi:hypothetical protein